jgi:hypothetical protein
MLYLRHISVALARYLRWLVFCGIGHAVIAKGIAG